MCVVHTVEMGVLALVDKFSEFLSSYVFFSRCCILLLRISGIGVKMCTVSAVLFARSKAGLKGFDVQFDDKTDEGTIYARASFVYFSAFQVLFA